MRASDLSWAQVSRLRPIALGNLTTSLGASDDAAHKHAVTHRAGVRNYWYDNNGNMLTRVELSGTQRITYTQAWDVENRLTVVTNTVTSQVTRFTYDGDGVRVKKVDSGGTTAYVGATEVLLTST